MNQSNCLNGNERPMQRNLQSDSHNNRLLYRFLFYYCDYQNINGRKLILHKIKTICKLWEMGDLLTSQHFVQQTSLVFLRCF